MLLKTVLLVGCGIKLVFLRAIKHSRRDFLLDCLQNFIDLSPIFEKRLWKESPTSKNDLTCN